MTRGTTKPRAADTATLSRLARREERCGVADYRAEEEIDADQARALVAEARTFLEAARAALDAMPR